MDPRTQDKMLQEWGTLSGEVRQNLGELPGVGPLVEVLEEATDQAASLRCRRDQLNAAKEETTLELKKALAGSRDAAMALRSYIKGVLDCRDERLAGYGIKPLRKRRRGRV